MPMLLNRRLKSRLEDERAGLRPQFVQLLPAPRPGDPARRRRHAGADAAYVFLVTIGWLGINLLVILGCAVAMFIVISHGQVDVFFLHVDNLAARYVAADLGRRAAFEHLLVQLFTILAVVILVLRGPGFVARLRRDLNRGRVV